MQKKRDRIKRLDVELNQSLDEASIAIKSAEKNSLNRDINTLIISRDEYTKQISRLDCILKDAKSKLDLFTKNRRGGEESLYTSVARDNNECVGEYGEMRWAHRWGSVSRRNSTKTLQKDFRRLEEISVSHGSHGGMGNEGRRRVTT